MNVIADSARISPLADIETSVRGSVLRVGEDVTIDAFVKIKFTGGLGDIVIGPNCTINSGCVIYSGAGVSIGADVLIAANCTIAAVNHAYADPSRRVREQGFMPSRGGVVIEDDVWIGANVALLDGAHVGRGAVVAAGSVVAGAVEPYTVVGGSPLRLLKRRGP